jgi:hypothetical protein
MLSTYTPIPQILTTISALNTSTSSIYFSNDNLGYYQMTWNVLTNATVIEVGRINSNTTGSI